MKTTTITTLLALAFLGLGLATAGETDEVAQDYERFATPGEEHALLAKLAGRYAVTIKAFGKESKGTCERKVILNGLFVREEFDGKCPCTGGPFQGLGTYGFDNAKRRFVSTWIDSAGSGVMVTEGTREGATITLSGKTTDPVTGKAKRVRSTLTLVDDRTQTYALFETGPDGAEAQVVEVTYVKD